VAEKSNQTTEALSLTLVKNFTVAILFDKWKYPKKKKRYGKQLYDTKTVNFIFKPLKLSSGSHSQLNI